MILRKGYTLIEMLLVVAIMGVLVGLLLGAVQKVRMAAAGVALKNQVRQLGVAVHAIEANYGRLPSSTASFSKDVPMVETLLPQLGYPSLSSCGIEAVFPHFVNKFDPSYAFYPMQSQGNSSFAFNYLVFESPVTANPISDGRSNTVMLAERYARCGPTQGALSAGTDVDLRSYVSAFKDSPPGGITIVCVSPRSLTFAERHVNDILPVYDPVTRTSSGSVPGVTFQVAPRPDACDPRVVQASTHSGLVVGMMDGSARTVAPSVAPSVYWSSLTPDKGEAVSLD